MSDVLGAIGPARLAAPAPAPGRGGAPPPSRPFGEVLGEVAGDRRAGYVPPPGAAAGPARGAAPPADAAPAPAALRRLLVDLVEGERRMDRVVRAAMGGRDFSMPELIAIQASVLKHAQTVEAVSRLLDRLTGAVKTTLQTQV